MAYVPGEKGKYIQELMDRSNAEWDKSDFEKSVSLLEQAWVELPEPKEIYDESFLIIWGILDIAIQIEDLDRMKKWVEFIFVTDPERGDFGERDLWAGKVAYETGDLEKAKSYLVLANQKSRGRCFGNKDGKYLRFLKQNS
jgi:tetratricopeptide (TPR) repeat protein